MRLLIAARKSDLAQLQARQVGEALRQKHPQLQIDFHFRESLGDREQNNPLWSMPEKGVFTEDFQAGLKNGEFDLVVHSWKDLPTEPRTETEIVATLPRADARDLLLIREIAWQQKKEKLKVLSSSPRRLYFLGEAWKSLSPAHSPELEFQAVRGNIPTRFEKLERGEGDALLVAKAAVDRMLQDPLVPQTSKETLKRVIKSCRWMILPLTLHPPAPGQGALAIEISKERKDLRDLLEGINCEKTFRSVQWERNQLREFGGGCHLKLGAYSEQVAGLDLRIIRGLPKPDQRIEKFWIERKSSNKAKGPALCLRSEDLFERQTLFCTLSGKNFYVSSYEAWRKELPSDSLLWTAGLSTWKKLAKAGVWVNGSDESFGEKTPEVASLRDSTEWIKLSHQASPESALPLLATYELIPRDKIEENLQLRIPSCKAFYWRSGSLFKRALELWPEIRTAHHSCGLGATRKILEAELGPLQDSQIFINEEEWRQFHELPSPTEI